ncbi:hypothetical protein HA402_001435 [Bradysia odoriphaga]|nr:hypothetical protein HA402_001435 [Bradysia odoriphaga]
MNSNSTQICRLCLETSGGLVNIFEKFQDSTVAFVLAEHFWFQIHKDDGMPEWVCEICWSQTKTFHNFYKRLELLHQNFLNSSVLVKVDEIKQERSVSPIEEAYEDNLFIDKCEEETDVTIKTDDTQIPSKEYSCAEDNSYDIGEQSEAEAEQTTDDDDEPSLDKPRRYKLHSRSEKEEQDVEIRRFFSMKCDICSDDEFDTLKKVRKHYREVHKTKAYFICCKNKYTKRCEMLDHVQYHVNPDAHRCDQCGKSYKDRKTLREHMKCHVRAHKCNFCSKTFPSAAKLKYHIRDKHSADANEKFPCDKCGKMCQSKLLLACHIRNVHVPSMSHVCEICGRTFKHKFNLQIHEQLEHSKTPLPKAQCNICGVWLKHELRLKKHHFTMHREIQEAKVFNCPICKKKVQTKTLLDSHIRRSHGEKKHQCTFCDKAFRLAKMLKEHIAALHTGIDLYSCTYCDRTFKSNANMYSHRKKAHLEEWSRDKAEKERFKQGST